MGELGYSSIGLEAVILGSQDWRLSALMNIVDHSDKIFEEPVLKLHLDCA